MIGWPVAAGMVAHATHWWSITVWHASLAVAALVSCLVVGTALAPIAYLLRIPFAAIGFAAVVALVPGMYVFQMLAGLVQLTSQCVAGPAHRLSIQRNGRGISGHRHGDRTRSPQPHPQCGLGRTRTAMTQPARDETQQHPPNPVAARCAPPAGAGRGSHLRLVTRTPRRS